MWSVERKWPKQVDDQAKKELYVFLTDNHEGCVTDYVRCKNNGMESFWYSSFIQYANFSWPKDTIDGQQWLEEQLYPCQDKNISPILKHTYQVCVCKLHMELDVTWHYDLTSCEINIFLKVKSEIYPSVQVVQQHWMLAICHNPTGNLLWYECLSIQYCVFLVCCHAWL